MEIVKGKGRTKGRNSTELMITVDVETITRPSEPRGKAGNPCAGVGSWLRVHWQLVAGVTVTLILLVAAGVLAGVFGSQRANSSTGKTTAAPYKFPGCGVRPGEDARVVNGQTATIAWPWQVSLQVEVSGALKHFCGASVISSTWLITARHCVTAVKNVTAIIAVLGTSSLAAGVVSAQRQTVRVASGLLFEAGDAGPDVALLRLAESVNYSTTVGLVCLPPNTTSKVQPGTLCYVTGWGYTIDQDQNSLPTDLQEGQVTILNDDRCIGTNDNYPLSPDMLCAANTTTQTDTCQGDSGGPLVCLAQAGQPSAGRWVLEGITSKGKACGSKQFPAVYTRVSAFADWIKRSTADTTTAAAAGGGIKSA